MAGIECSSALRKRARERQVTVRPLRLIYLLTCAFLFLGSTRFSAAQSVPAPEVQVSHYHIDLSFQFSQHEMKAVAQVTLTALQPATSVSFLLNQNLNVQSVTEDTSPLTSTGTNETAAPASMPRPPVLSRTPSRIHRAHRRAPQAAVPAAQGLNFTRTGASINVFFPVPLMAGQILHLAFHYQGVLANAALSPIPGLETVHVGPKGSFLLYPGEWFPLVGYDTDRFTMTVSATLPPPYGLLASGAPTAQSLANNTIVYTYKQTQATFPGSIAITPLRAQTFTLGGLTSNFYFGPNVPAALVQKYAQAASSITGFISQSLGNPPSDTLLLVELPDGSLPSYSSPNLIFLSRGSIGNALNYRLLTDEISQQWLGNLVSPASMSDAWIQYGAARFFEALYVESLSGPRAYRSVINDLMVGALSYGHKSLAQTGGMYPFSPAFQDLTYDKGAILFHMLRWQLGQKQLLAGMRQFVRQYAWKSATTADLEQVLEKSSGEDLSPFFSEWYNGTGVPEFHNTYTVYRLYTGGFRVVGRLRQNLDLFDMPVDMRVVTDGQPVMQRIQVHGRASSYVIATPRRPRKVEIDPEDWLLKSNAGIEVRVEIARGDNYVSAGDFPKAIQYYQRALKVNPLSSLAHYRIAEADFQEENWQGAADQYRDALNGDLRPEWIRVWSRIQLGKIFDLTGQRNRAINEYERALQTHDNTDGALTLARQYLKTPFKKQGAATPA